MSAGPEGLPTPASIAKYVKRNAAKAKKASAMVKMRHHEEGQEIVRQDDYKGHHIVVRTVYRISVDGKKVTGHIMLTNDGQVQYHGLPNWSFDSAIQLARTLIDNFPEDFERASKGSGAAGMLMDGGRARSSQKSPKTATRKGSREQWAKRKSK